VLQALFLSPDKKSQRTVKVSLLTSKTSAEPQRLDTERLPCLAMRPPAAAATTQAPVLMLTLPMLSPPVPTMSSTAAASRT